MIAAFAAAASCKIKCAICILIYIPNKCFNLTFVFFFFLVLYFIISLMNIVDDAKRDEEI